MDTNEQETHVVALTAARTAVQVQAIDTADGALATTMAELDIAREPQTLSRMRTQAHMKMSSAGAGAAGSVPSMLLTMRGHWRERGRNQRLVLQRDQDEKRVLRQPLLRGTRLVRLPIHRRREDAARFKPSKLRDGPRRKRPDSIDRVQRRNALSRSAV
jgi:hypothetical protein